MLQKSGFQRLSETSEWQLKAGGRYYFTRNLSTLVAFAVGADYKPVSGFHMVGAHTDRYNIFPVNLKLLTSMHGSSHQRTSSQAFHFPVKPGAFGRPRQAFLHPSHMPSIFDRAPNANASNSLLR